MKKNLIFLTLFFLSFLSFAQPSITLTGSPADLNKIEEDKLNEIFMEYKVFTFSKSELELAKSKKNIIFNLPGTSFPQESFEFIDSDLFAADYKKESNEVKSLLENNSFLRAINLERETFSLTISKESISGRYHSGVDGDWNFSTIRHFFGKDFSEEKVVVYRSDSYKKGHEDMCGTEGIVQNLKKKYRINTFGINNYCRKIFVAIEGDNEWNSFFGVNASSQMASIMNTVTTIFGSELSMVVQVSSSTLWTTTDPYTSTSITKGPALSEFRNWWNSNRTGITRDCALLFSKRTFALEGGLQYVGVAYANSLCSSDAYGMIANPLNIETITCHELAHIVGHTGHDDSPTGTIMETANSGNISSFSNYSKDLIWNNLASGLENCIITGSFQMYKDGILITTSDINYVCLSNWYNMNAAGINSITWSVQNFGTSAYIVSSSSSSATVSAGSNAGTFTVKASKSNACGNIDRYYQFDASSCFRYSVFPNPSSSKLTIAFDDLNSIENFPNKIELISDATKYSALSINLSEEFTKKTIKDGSKIELDVKSLPRGIYYLIITNLKLENKPTETVRILIE
ncbi:M12 family metallo-peptidase [Emticicia sp. C21]|uniref:M12 family metallo-peptidase n=1 Tax=Emticicia sp. C21 TaxID=2302915 RepID=UPI000E34C704|nr:M12 family metallo-peptidase [Emticicia sp. C21]RFS15970.1 hypothetical protein D0T08_13800 [Emticicia sp. C21]